MLPTCLLEPVSLSHHVCDLAESGGFPGGKRESGGKDFSRVPNGLSVGTVATAMPNQPCVAVREPRPLPPCQPAAGTPAKMLTTSTSARKRAWQRMPLLRSPWAKSCSLTRNAKTYHRENMFHRDGLARTAPKTKAPGTHLSHATLA